LRCEHDRAETTSNSTSIVAPRALRAPGARALVLSCALLAACGSHDVTQPPSRPDDADGATNAPLPPLGIDLGASGPVEIFMNTYDGSGQTVEPDVVFLPGGFHGFEYWLAINPYPDGSDALENASIYYSRDGLAWSVPEGLVNPVVPYPTGDIHYNSDPDLVYVPATKQLVLFDRAVTTNSNLIRQMTSMDGVHWTPPVTVLEGPRHTLISPAVAAPPGRRPRMWVVDAGAWGCSAPATHVTMRRWVGDSTHTGAPLVGRGWGPPVVTDLAAPGTLVIWHLDVTWVAELEEYWAVFPAHRSDEGCDQDDLYIARSRNGTQWTTLATPIISRGDAPIAARSVYRASLVYDAPAGGMKVWFSGLSRDATWHLGYEEFPVRSLAAALDRQAGNR
jgi:hypothetical protein